MQRGGLFFYFLFFNLAEPAASAASVQFTALGIWLCSPLILNEFHGPDVCHLSPRYFKPTGTSLCVCVCGGGGGYLVWVRLSYRHGEGTLPVGNLSPP